MTEVAKLVSLGTDAVWIQFRHRLWELQPVSYEDGPRLELDRWAKRREREEIGAGEELILEEAFPADAPPELRRGLLAGFYRGFVEGVERLRKRILAG